MNMIARLAQQTLLRLQPQLIYGGEQSYARNGVACQSWQAMRFMAD